MAPKMGNTFPVVARGIGKVNLFEKQFVLELSFCEDTLNQAPNMRK